ncbi:MAG: hypothetical protein HPY53_15155 [Brevinematales bacterium]|nr:hypothetical protein [Brevinematales bacterium]
MKNYQLISVEDIKLSRRGEYSLSSGKKIVSPNRRFIYMTLLNSSIILLVAVLVFGAFSDYIKSFNFYKDQVVPRQKIISDIKSGFMFDGVIFHYYNYIFTGNPKDVDILHNKLEAIKKTILKYKVLSQIKWVSKLN